MQNLWFIKYIVTLLLFFATVAFAQNDFPTGYQFWTEDRKSMLQVRCMPTDDNNGDINCEMITTIFFPKAKSEDLNKELRNGWHKEIFDDNGEIKDKKTFSSLCSKELIGITKLALGYEMNHKDFGVSKQDFEKAKEGIESKIGKLASGEKKDKLDEYKLLLSFCENGDFQSAKNMMIHEHRVNERTCSIGVRHHERIFKRINDGVYAYKSDQDMSECSAISVETMRRTGEYPWNWEIEFKQISLNPDGKTLTGISCKEIDKNPDLYKPIVEVGKVYSGCSYFE